MKKATLFLCLLVAAAPATAQQVAPAARPPAPDPFAMYLFPPELVMSHQEAIGLTDRQRTAIQEAIKETQGKMMDVQFKMASLVEKISHALGAATVDEAAVLQLVDQVLSSGREMKRAQMSLMIRIKNQLSAEQQSALDKLRKPPPE